MAYDNNNSGALFKNDLKDNPKQPDYKGSVQVDGQDYWIAAWIKKGKKGTFMSLAFTPKDAPRATGGGGQQGSGRQETSEFDNDIPF